MCSLVECGEVWTHFYGEVRCNEVRFGNVMLGLVKCCVVWLTLLKYGLVRSGVVKFCDVRCGRVGYGKDQFLRFGWVRSGMVG